MKIEEKEKVFKQEIAALKTVVDLCEQNTWTERVYLELLIKKQEEYYAFMMGSFKKKCNNKLPSQRSLTGTGTGRKEIGQRA